MNGSALKEKVHSDWPSSRTLSKSAPFHQRLNDFFHNFPSSCSDECHHLKTGNCLTTNGNEEIFDIDGRTSCPRQKTKTIVFWGPQNSFQNRKLSLARENTGYLLIKSVANANAGAFT